MAGVYFRCGDGVSSFIIHSNSSSLYPQTCSSSSYVYYSAFAATSSDCWISGVSTSTSGTIKMTDGSSTWNYSSDPYVSTTTSGRYITVYVEETTYAVNYIYFKCGTGISSYSMTYADATSTGVSTTISGSTTYMCSVRSGTNATMYATSYATGYGSPRYFQAYTSLSFDTPTGDPWSAETNPRVYSSGTRFILLYATAITYNYILHYDANGGTSGTTTKQQYIGTTTTAHRFTIPSDATPTRANCTFLGWSFSSTATTATYVAGDTVNLSYTDPEKTLYAVWKHTALTTFSWTSDDATNIATGQPIGNIKATAWNTMIYKINQVAECYGGSFSTQYTGVQGNTITANHYNALATGIRNLTGAGTITKTSVSTGDNMLASYFQGSGSIKNALNTAITYWNNT